MFDGSITFNQKTKVLIACSLVAFISLLILVDLVVGSKRPADRDTAQDPTIVISKADKTAKNDATTIEQLINEIEAEVLNKATKDDENKVTVDSIDVNADKSQPMNTADNASGETAMYTVREGDSYWIISKRVLGQGSRWEEIKKLNPEVADKALRKGMVIKVPTRTLSNTQDVKKGVKNAESSPVQASNKYTVRKGDSLWKIAQMVNSGDTIEQKMKMLLRENKGKIVKGEYLVPGVTLTIP